MGALLDPSSRKKHENLNIFDFLSVVERDTLSGSEEP